MRAISTFHNPFARLLLSLSLVLGLAGGAALAQDKMDKKDKAKGKMATKKDDQKNSLYNRLGGKQAITKVVDDFVANVAADQRINGLFAKTAADPKRMKTFKGHLVDQICEAAGGPCKYKGMDMKTAHQGMNIKESDFNALVEDLVKALDKNKVGQKEKDELLGALGGMKGQIVGQ